MFDMRMQGFSLDVRKLLCHLMGELECGVLDFKRIGDLISKENLEKVSRTSKGDEIINVFLLICSDLVAEMSLNKAVYKKGQFYSQKARFLEEIPELAHYTEELREGAYDAQFFSNLLDDIAYYVNRSKEELVIADIRQFFFAIDIVSDVIKSYLEKFDTTLEDYYKGSALAYFSILQDVVEKVLFRFNMYGMAMNSYKTGDESEFVAVKKL